MCICVWFVLAGILGICLSPSKPTPPLLYGVAPPTTVQMALCLYFQPVFFNGCAACMCVLLQEAGHTRPPLDPPLLARSAHGSALPAPHLAHYV